MYYVSLIDIYGDKITRHPANVQVEQRLLETFAFLNRTLMSNYKSTSTWYYVYISINFMRTTVTLGSKTSWDVKMHLLRTIIIVYLCVITAKKYQQYPLRLRKMCPDTNLWTWLHRHIRPPYRVF